MDSLTNNQAYLSEIFSSYQGEGVFTGLTQVFLRFSVCHMRCYYCDTPYALTKQKHAKIESTPFSREFEERRNPLKLSDIENYITATTAQHNYHSISFTGGEPLLQFDIINKLADFIHNKTRLYTFLETSGTLPALLKQVIHNMDIVSLDIKPPSCKGVRSKWEEIEECVALSHDKQLQVKIVITQSSPTQEEVTRISELMLKYHISPLLTPVTKINNLTDTSSGERLIKLKQLFFKSGVEANCVPQLHRIVNWL
ncbi:MAG: 7-carboxy-7-deazaguanine synthase QueE [Planctomycetes bacterium]|nr:7-carboxy-7-deazaguanine synthase QueE [Planctomycetota bacterium]